MRSVFKINLAVLLLFGIAAAGDIEGSKDHPVISRYPGSAIRWYQVDNYRPYKIPTGPVTGYRHIDNWIETEGQVTRIYYSLDGGQRTYDEVYKNYFDALKSKGFEIIAEGLRNASYRGRDIGSRSWQAVFFTENPFNSTGAVSAMVRGSATSGGRGTVIGKKERAAGTLYVAISVYQFSDNNVSTLVDVVEVGQAETGLVVVDPEAIGSGIQENGRVILDGILFDFDKATLKPESKKALGNIAAYLKANPSKKFYVVGHTDSKGSFDYNRNLSLSRARAVVETLIEDYSIQSARLVAHGVGPLVPVFANTSDTGREKNRRVELVEQ